MVKYKPSRHVSSGAPEFRGGRHWYNYTARLRLSDSRSNIRSAAGATLRAARLAWFPAWFLRCDLDWKFSGVGQGLSDPAFKLATIAHYRIRQNDVFAHRTSGHRFEGPPAAIDHLLLQVFRQAQKHVLPENAEKHVAVDKSRRITEYLALCGRRPRRGCAECLD